MLVRKISEQERGLRMFSKFWWSWWAFSTLFCSSPIETLPYSTVLFRTLECYLSRNMHLNMASPPSTNFKFLTPSKAPFLNIDVKIGEHHHLVVYAALLEGTTDIFRRFLGMDWWWWLRLRQLKCTFSELLQTQFLCSFTRTMRFPLNNIYLYHCTQLWCPGVVQCCSAAVSSARSAVMNDGTRLPMALFSLIPLRLETAAGHI